MSLAWPWPGRSLPKGNQWEFWGPGLGPSVFWLPVLLPPTIWPTWRLTGWFFFTWLVGWPIAGGRLAGWLTSYQTKCQPDPPQAETSCPVCDYFGHIDLWSNVPSTVQTSHGKVRTPMAPMRVQAGFAFSQMSDQVNIISDAVPTAEEVVWTGKDDWPPGWLLHHERPYTWEGNCLG